MFFLDPTQGFHPDTKKHTCINYCQFKLMFKELTNILTNPIRVGLVIRGNYNSHYLAVQCDEHKLDM